MSKQTLRDKIAEVTDHATHCLVHDEAAYAVADAVLDLLSRGFWFDEAVERMVRKIDRHIGVGTLGLDDVRVEMVDLLRAALGEGT